MHSWGKQLWNTSDWGRKRQQTLFNSIFLSRLCQKTPFKRILHNTRPLNANIMIIMVKCKDFSSSKDSKHYSSKPQGVFAQSWAHLCCCRLLNTSVWYRLLASHGSRVAQLSNYFMHLQRLAMNAAPPLPFPLPKPRPRWAAVAECAWTTRRSWVEEFWNAGRKGKAVFKLAALGSSCGEDKARSEGTQIVVRPLEKLDPKPL